MLDPLRDDLVAEPEFFLELIHLGHLREVFADEVAEGIGQDCTLFQGFVRELVCTLEFANPGLGEMVEVEVRRPVGEDELCVVWEVELEHDYVSWLFHARTQRSVD